MSKVIVQDVKFVILVTEEALLQGHLKCGKYPYLFATIVANTKILLDIAVLYCLNSKYMQSYVKKLFDSAVPQIVLYNPDKCNSM